MRPSSFPSAQNESLVWLGVGIAIYIGALAVFALLGVRPPRVPPYLFPGMLGANYLRADLCTEDGVPLRAWWLPAEAPPLVVIGLHGYLSNRCELLVPAWRFQMQGYAVLLLDSRGHGQSGGRCGLGAREVADVRAAIAEARRSYPDADIVLYGSSMGGAAVALAAGYSPGLADALILDSAYSRPLIPMSGIARLFLGRTAEFLLRPAKPLVGWWAGVNPYRIDVAEALGRFTGPVLLLHGRRDAITPPAEAERNRAACPQAALEWFEAGHIMGRMQEPERYQAILDAFLASVVQTTRVSSEDNP